MHAQEELRPFPIAILATAGGGEMARAVDEQLRDLFQANGQHVPATFVRESQCLRFQNGEGKGVIAESVRGADLYVIADVGNSEARYTRNGADVSMSPDEHYQDLKRLLAAAKNMPQRTTVIMPMLYESRQHRLTGRESLDCALALQELANLGVYAIITIDAHNSHVQNAIPMNSLENLHTAYQLIKAFLESSGVAGQISPEQLVVCSPDLGGMSRARYFAEHFRVHLTGFYKVRDLTRVVNGKNPVIEHQFLGSDLKGKDVFVVDDMLASGGSMLEVCEELKKRGAARVFLAVTFALFSEGYDRFDAAYEAGLFEKLYGTNATCVPGPLKAREWFVEVDVTRFLAKFIQTFNRDGSVTQLLDSTGRINELMGVSLPGRGAG